MPNALSRRDFLSDSFSVASTFGLGAAFSALGSRLALADPTTRKQPKLVAAIDRATGLPLIRLPEGFSYVTYGWHGDRMSDATRTPDKHDGMAVIRADGNRLTLCRNHEARKRGNAIPIQNGTPYDPRGTGGCTNLTFDADTGEWLRSWVSLSGTYVNCAGGPTPWNTWLTCEETVLGPGGVYELQKLELAKEHGWIFEVPATGTATPVPLKDMGRFVHEAIAVDRETGVVYETEDAKSAGFYRFVPRMKEVLSEGGTLEIAEIVGHDDLSGGFEQGAEFDVRWHPIPDPHVTKEPKTSVFAQGKKRGGSTFARLEGCWAGNGKIYFDSTNGGAAQAGQIWQYDPSNQKLKLLFESPGKDRLNMPDNLCVNPHGGLMLCEDGDYGLNRARQRMHTLSLDGHLTVFAENNVDLRNVQVKGIKPADYRSKEWAGATFCPNGKWLFCNIQTPGITFAITGPWADVLA